MSKVVQPDGSMKYVGLAVDLYELAMKELNLTYVLECQLAD